MATRKSKFASSTKKKNDPNKRSKKRKEKKKLLKIKKKQEHKRLSQQPKTAKSAAKKLEGLPLRERMLEKLKASRFRFMNEELYNMKSKEAVKYFRKDKESFMAYHEGYKQQLEQWPINPLSVIIKSLKKLTATKKNLIIADFGCGEATLAKSLPEAKVHSFDLVALDPCVTICDMAKTPLQDGAVDVAVFCLSLMGVNLTEYLLEANRVLKLGGVLKIAEIESRFEDVDAFISTMTRYGFVNTMKNFSNNVFYFMDFKKETTLGKHFKKKAPAITLKPCVYKKR